MRMMSNIMTERQCISWNIKKNLNYPIHIISYHLRTYIHTSLYYYHIHVRVCDEPINNPLSQRSETSVQSKLNHDNNNNNYP